MDTSLQTDDTIVAVSSPPGGSARGIVRVSGPGVPGCLRGVFVAEDSAPLDPVTRAAALNGRVSLPGTDAALPCQLYLWPKSRSYTGQAVAEIHTVGSPPILEALVASICQRGARLAEPGEFTLRAFLAGRIDLTQAEAVLGVIDAADARQLDVALAQLAGGLAGPLSALRDRLIELLAHLEAGFDFADEDIEFITPGELRAQIDAAQAQIEHLVEQMSARAEAAELPRAVLVGWPNTGKSSLFNALTERPGALVSEHPGTTRDYLQAELDLDGVKCLLVDTAGRSDESAIAAVETERLAQQLASEQAQHAVVRLLCLDVSRPRNDWETRQLEAAVPGARIVVLTKTDLAMQAEPGTNWVATSSVTGEGIDRLRARLLEVLLEAATAGGDTVPGTAVRCRESLRLAAESLARASDLLDAGLGEELVASEIRVTLEELGKVVGAVYTDDILDHIFSRFCIGK